MYGGLKKVIFLCVFLEDSAHADGDLAPGSEHARHSARHPIKMSEHFSEHVSAKSTSKISPNPSDQA